MSNDPLLPSNPAADVPANTIPRRLRARTATPKSADGNSSINSPAFIMRSMWRWMPVALPVSLVLIGCSAIALWATFVPSYRAAAWVQIQETPTHLAYPVQDNPKRFIQNQLELMRSPLVVSPALGKIDVGTIPGLQTQQDQVAWLTKRVRVASIGDSELFEVSFDSTDPTAAVSLVNALIDSYLALRAEHDTTRSQRMLELLDEEKRLRSQEVTRMRENVRELGKQIYGKDPFTGIPNPGVVLLNNPLETLVDRMSAHEFERKMLEVQLATMQEATGKPAKELPVVLIDGAVEQRAEVKELKTLLASKQTMRERVADASVHGEKDPAYHRVTRDMERLEQLLSRTRLALRSTVKDEIAANAKLRQSDELEAVQLALEKSKLGEKALQEQYADRVKSAGQNGSQSLDLEFARAELEREERVFELIAQRALALRTETRAPARVTLMKAATVPSNPIETFPLKKLLMAAAGCLAVPFGLAILWERSVRRINDADQLDQDAQVSVLGEVAKLPLKHGRLRPSETSQEALSLFEESVDSLRTCLVLDDTHQGVRVIAVTSAISGEGKTSVAAQLAVSIARATSEKTLLIDADLRSPDVHRVFKIEATPGLAGVLERKCAFEDAIVSTWSEYVHVLPAGQVTANPHTLLNNGMLRRLLDVAKDRYAYVIVDTPPILLASEALVVAKEADGTLLCTMRNYSREHQVKAACERLRAVGAKNLGAVLSGVPSRQYATKYGSYSNGREYSHA